jgi:hypothetical protein
LPEGDEDPASSFFIFSEGVVEIYTDLNRRAATIDVELCFKEESIVYGSSVVFLVRNGAEGRNVADRPLRFLSFLSNQVPPTVENCGAAKHFGAKKCASTTRHSGLKSDMESRGTTSGIVPSDVAQN